MEREAKRSEQRCITFFCASIEISAKEPLRLSTIFICSADSDAKFRAKDKKGEGLLITLFRQIGSGEVIYPIRNKSIPGFPLLATAKSVSNWPFSQFHSSKVHDDVACFIDGDPIPSSSLPLISSRTFEVKERCFPPTEIKKAGIIS